MGIRDFLNKLKSDRTKSKEYAAEMRMQERYEEKKKSSNERELERFMEEQREKEIKNELERWRKIRSNEVNYGHQILRVKNMFKGEKPAVLNNKKMFGHKYHMHEGKGLFFK